MKLKKGLKLKNMAGEPVLIMQGYAGKDMTKVIAFNATSEWLWNRLYDKEFVLKDVSGLLVERFELDNVTAENDARKWIEQLSNCCILDV
jgi:hypothetical protein